MMDIIIQHKKGGQWQQAPQHYLTGYSFAGGMLELQGREVICKVTADIGIAIVCGTAEILAAVKVKHPDAIHIASVEQWENGTWNRRKIVTDCATFGGVIEKHYPKLAAEMFPQVWTDVMAAIAGVFPDADIIEIKEVA